MKAFKKRFEIWWNALCCIGDAEALEKSKSRYQTGFCNGWRGALEEVLKQLNEIYDNAGAYDFEKSEMVTWIEEELKGG